LLLLLPMAALVTAVDALRVPLRLRCNPAAAAAAAWLLPA
jgi:hypothetical protein